MTDEKHLWSEMCAVVDIPVGVALVVATLAR